MHYFWTCTWKLYCFLERGNLCNTIVVIIIISVYLFISIILYKSGMLGMEYVIKKHVHMINRTHYTRIKWNI